MAYKCHSKTSCNRSTGAFVTYQGGDPEHPLWIGTWNSKYLQLGLVKEEAIHPPAGLLSYGAFHDVTTQSAVANTATPIKFGVTDLSSGVVVASTSHIAVAYAGVYNVQFSVQFHGLSGGGNGTTCSSLVSQKRISSTTK
jgi:hypothetical protein